MRNTSSAYKKQIKGIREFCAKIIINYADGSTQTLTDLQDFKQLKFVDECSGSSEFELGAAVIGEALITLNNRTGKFDGKNFYGAHISAYAGILVNGKPELLEMGHYIVDEPVSPGISIALTAYDNMILLEKAYVPGITYPATLGNITKDICAQCGVILESSDFPRNSYVVESAPENATCREVLAAAAQLAGCFAKARANGRIAIAWYAAASSLAVDTLRNKSICTDDVTITGITVSKGESTAQAGADGYRLSIIDNILLEESKIQETANYLASKLVGLSFRPLSVSCQSDPSIEAGDRITIKDGDATYATVVTSTTFAVLEAQKVACNAASPTVNAGKRLSETSKAIIANRKYTDEAMEHERTERETALEDLNKQLAEASGMYTTAQRQADGRTIYYTHDKPELKDSKIVWKLTATALGISTDGGKTYPIGLDVSGTAILNRIYVTGIDGKYVKIENEKLSEYVEKINQTATDAKNNADDAKKKAENAANTANKTVAAMSVEYYKSNSATELKGGTWQSGAVTAAQGYYIWSRTKTVAQDGTVTYSQAACITGNTGVNGEQGASLITVITEYSYNKAELAAYSKDGYSGTWKVKNTEGIKVGDTVLLRVYNTTTKSYSFIVAKVTAVNTTSSQVTCTSMGLIEKGEDGAQGIQGIQGPKGEQGIPGADGTNGKSSYFHIAYANSADGKVDFSVGVASGRAYIGTYVDYTPTDSTDYTKYTWQLVKGAQGAKGDQGIPGTNGVNGKTSYLHIAYANSADGKNGFDVSDGTGKLYIGQYTDYTQADSIDPTKYTWSKIKGETGRGVKTIVPQYYLSTTSTKQEGGSWSTTQPAWAEGKYIWTRSYIIWDDGTTSTTTPVLASALNGLGQDLSEVKETVSKQGSSLKVVENQIQEKVWKEDITTEIKNLRIGGRNLAQKQSQDWQSFQPPKGINQCHSFLSEIPAKIDESIPKGTKVTCTIEIKWEKCAVESGKTMSAWMQGSQDGGWNNVNPFTKNLYTYDGTASGQKIYTVTNEWDGLAHKYDIQLRCDNSDGNGIFYWRCLKAEIGDKATDWTPAPEDIDGAVDQAQSTADQVSTTVTTVTTQVESLKTATEALSKAMQSYVKEDELETYKKQVESQLSQTPDAIEARFKTVEQNISKVGSSSDDKWAQLETYIRLTQNGIALGKSDSPITLEIRNDRICFVQSGQTVAYYTNNQLYNSNLVVTTTANILGLIFTKSGRHLQIS